ncbi:DNA-binding protein [Longimycelium tulufanense]|uniref:DNA-binding protein n=1 Tax=Longimycelium tulufanense TaxID=907463 RepID=A0A8J3FU82_9PSEU|nr:LacI family DNA-binding transcriptional regulator [Longimycelium tulufanense]GGM41367.1 DNA-binding protein [Longimycelium tulufanense]
MTGRFRIRDIASQAGLSEATVDRVLHRRPGVSARAVRAVEQALTDLERQETQLRLTGRTFLIDVVMHAPQRFSDAVRGALEAELPLLRPVVIRVRFHLRESWPVDDLLDTLDTIARRGSQGVLLKAPDVPEMVAAVDRLTTTGIPVVALVTDLPTSRRAAYVGIDNRAAGATAAYLIQQWLGDRPGSVLVTVSRGFFRGEEEREMGFRAAMRSWRLSRSVVEISDTDGLDATLRDRVDDCLSNDLTINAVYSIGGGNVATLDAFAAAGRECAVYIAHDLDVDNIQLLRQGRISAVLHHDLHTDMRHACQVVMQTHRALPTTPPPAPSQIQVITPHNLPS